MSYIAEAVQRARHLGQSPEAAAAWRDLLGQTHVDEADYSDWARELAYLYARLGRLDGVERPETVASRGINRC